MRNFNGDMISQGHESVPEPMKNWRECPDEYLAQAFQLPPSERTGWGYPGQIGRIGCIDFGSVTKEVADLIQKHDVRLSLCHGLVERSEPQRFRTQLVSNYVYTMLLEVIHKENGQDIIKYYQASEEASDGSIAGPQEIPWSQPSKHTGIKKETKDQFCHNWCYLPNADVSSMFYSFGPNIEYMATILKEKRDVVARLALELEVENVQELVKKPDLVQLLRAISDKKLSVPVRGLKYPIVGSNLTDLRAIVEEGSHLRVHLGVNPSDFTQDKDLFTIIIEVDNSHSPTGGQQLDGEDGGSGLFDYVNACPPLCCGGPGQPACP